MTINNNDYENSLPGFKQGIKDAKFDKKDEKYLISLINKRIFLNILLILLITVGLVALFFFLKKISDYYYTIFLIIIFLPTTVFPALFRKKRKTRQDQWMADLIKEYPINIKFEEEIKTDPKKLKRRRIIKIILTVSYFGLLIISLMREIQFNIENKKSQSDKTIYEKNEMTVESKKRILEQYGILQNELILLLQQSIDTNKKIKELSGIIKEKYSDIEKEDLKEKQEYKDLSELTDQESKLTEEIKIKTSELEDMENKYPDLLD